MAVPELHPNLGKIIGEGRGQGAHFYFITFDRTDFPHLPEGQTQVCLVSTRRPLTAD